MMSKILRQIFAIMLLIALAFALRAAFPALAPQQTTIAKGTFVTWRGGGSSAWSNPANWQEGFVPREHDLVRFPAGAPDALLDSSFNGVVGGVILEAGYQGTVTLARQLTVREDLAIAGGTFIGGAAPLIVEGKATVTGGMLTTPSNIMSVAFLEIEAPGVVVLSANGKLSLTGDGTPLTGGGLLDTSTNAPNSVEYTGHATADLMTAGPAVAFHELAGMGRLASHQQHMMPLNEREARLFAPTIFTRTNSLTLQPGESGAQSAVIDTANGFAYFGTATSWGRVVKVQLSDFTRVGVLTLNPGENELYSAAIDATNGFAYFGTRTQPGIVIKVQLSNFMRVGALTLNTGENNLYSAVIDTANGFAYFGTNTDPGIVVKVNLNGVLPPTRSSALTLNFGECCLFSAVTDTANGVAYFGANIDPGIVVKVDLNGVITPTRVAALTLNIGEDNLRSAVIDTANGFAYFGSDKFGNPPDFVVKVKLSTLTRVDVLYLIIGENRLASAVIDMANGFAYFGTETSPGRVVKVKLSTLTRVDALTLNTGENALASAVIDTFHGFAYFGTSTDPGIVVKINLVERLFLPLIIR